MITEQELEDMQERVKRGKKDYDHGLFSAEETIGKNFMTKIRFDIKGTPIPKQSFQFSIARHGQNINTSLRYQITYYDKKLKKERTVYGPHKGDVVLFVNDSGHLNVIANKYQKPEVKKEEARIARIIKEQLPDGFSLFSEKVHITKMHFIFPMLKSFSKKKVADIKMGKLVEKTTKPDMQDNLKKIVFDAMEGIVMINDSLISMEDNIKKYYGVEPGIIIEMEGM